MSEQISLRELRERRVIAPDPRSTTQFAPFVHISHQALFALVDAVKAAQTAAKTFSAFINEVDEDKIPRYDEVAEAGNTLEAALARFKDYGVAA